MNGSADKPGADWNTYSEAGQTVNGSFGSGLGQVMQHRPILNHDKPASAVIIRDATSTLAWSLSK